MGVSRRPSVKGLHTCSLPNLDLQPLQVLKRGTGGEGEGERRAGKGGGKLLLKAFEWPKHSPK